MKAQKMKDNEYKKKLIEAIEGYGALFFVPTSARN